MKLVAQTAALFWSVEHVFCNFEVGTAPKETVVGLADGSAFPGAMVVFRGTRWDG
jgi:hypothetical protein